MAKVESITRGVTVASAHNQDMPCAAIKLDSGEVQIDEAMIPAAPDDAAFIRAHVNDLWAKLDATPLDWSAIDGA